MVNKSIILEKIDELIIQAKSWKEDADERNDFNDWFYHDGQLNALNKLKGIIKK
ncbi:hypothetical protein [Peribacillus frigoritolerans]|uniref:hypothetical protein n=1 Tax=Peribacillus frigoritolerans TaxID=450367 RepID=UPI00227EC1C3|nr:hypothetical protein [Peribacillus frigoritolerans]MCY9007209.1 hypothetical protein [Peribacillus frigoritolerans]